ncbi:protein of unknown function (plasmid) [Pararobbsia alpina]
MFDVVADRNGGTVDGSIELHFSSLGVTWIVSAAQQRPQSVLSAWSNVSLKQDLGHYRDGHPFDKVVW